MTTKLKTLLDRTNVVGVIASEKDMQIALDTPEGINLFEIRIDRYMPALSLVSRLRRSVIITVRDGNEGGAQKSWTPRKRAGLYHKYMPVATLIDIEASTANRLSKTIEEAKQHGVGLIISKHIFDGTFVPSDIDRAVSVCKSFGGHVFKVALLPDDLGDFAEFLGRMAILSSTYGVKFAPMSMGERFGIVSRLLFGTNGAVFVYGYLDAAAVPGQLRAADIRKKLDEMIP